MLFQDFILFPVFGGEKAAAKIQTVKGLRVEIFSRCARKNTTRPLTVWIGGTAAEAITAIGIIGSVIPPLCFSAVKVLLVRTASDVFPQFVVFISSYMIKLLAASVDIHAL